MGPMKDPMNEDDQKQSLPVRPVSCSNTTPGVIGDEIGGIGKSDYETMPESSKKSVHIQAET